MDKNQEKTIYLISGPCGVGKSTLTKELLRNVKKSALIKGDDFLSIYDKDSEPPWDEMLMIMWKNILSLTQNLLQHNFNVIIDTVVEDELEWFCKHFAYLNLKIKYVVLLAEENILIERLNRRGDPFLIDRSLFLLNKLEREPANSKHLYNTSYKKPAEIIEDILNSSSFIYNLAT
ncbi:gluconate kinase [Neobacillus niacini]|uniref:AAA family ATPase n=1 Tax=Neobacillus driksii TaxID=3035913 RepID=UPI00278B2697|nr:AAA family ATPase [Neobacillus niacini]MDQ0974638.1 gluconate kinase [Neobacillus niacini]